MPRNRLLTEARLLEAARAIVAESGFSKLGVNSAAARAGYDKVLIYRYFGGYDGLLERLAQSEDFFPHAAEVLPREDPGNPLELLRDFARRMDEAMSTRHLTRALARWESATDNALCQAYRDARKRLRASLEAALSPDPASALLLELVFRRLERSGFDAAGALTGFSETDRLLRFTFSAPELPAKKPEAEASPAGESGERAAAGRATPSPFGGSMSERRRAAAGLTTPANAPGSDGQEATADLPENLL
ncbi:MAG: TetR/AcrR family transcriptional regulator [Opitutales bacterium]